MGRITGWWGRVAVALVLFGCGADTTRDGADALPDTAPPPVDAAAEVAGVTDAGSVDVAPDATPLPDVTLPEDAAEDVAEDVATDVSADASRDTSPPAACDPPCEAPYPACVDGACEECTEQAHCPYEHTCDDVTHQCVDDLRCLGVECFHPYPVCAVYAGRAVCVQCRQDHHCGLNGNCDAEHYSCVGAVGLPDRDCREDGCLEHESVTLDCDPSSGTCYTPDGWCDNLYAFCHEASGSTCLPPILYRVSPTKEPIPPAGFGLCTCDTLVVADCAADPTSPSCDDGPRCWPGQICLALMTAKAFGPSTLGMCIDPELLEALRP